MTQRLTQTADFWQNQFQIAPATIEELTATIIEDSEPLSIETIGLFVVKHTLEAQERKIRSEVKQGKPYLPQEAYEVGDRVLFPNLAYAIGKVVASRAGYNAVDGDFTVIDVQFEDQSDLTVSFASGLQTPHSLQMDQEAASPDDQAEIIQKLYKQFQPIIRPVIEETLGKHKAFVSFAGYWFLEDLLLEVQEGLLNIVDAAIDIHNAPLNVDTLIEQIDLQGNGSITEAMRFSVNYCLARDKRFENVGGEREVLWYLDRLKPALVKEPPVRLRADIDMSFDYSLLDNEQRALLAEIDDEATPAEYTKAVEKGASSVTFALNYHHYRLGTLPVLPAVASILPPAKGQSIALQLVDGRTGDEMLCWYVSEHHYIWGLEAWYQKYKLPVGTILTLTKTDSATRLVIDFVAERAHVDHIKVAVSKNDKLGFEIRKRRHSCKYDELMIIGVEDPAEIDLLWESAAKNSRSVSSLLIHILPELMRFTSQGTVHIKTIYSAVNILKRCSPGVLMQELIKDDAFISMGHGYWTYRPTGSE